MQREITDSVFFYNLQCNTTCGEGLQTRTAVCQAVTKEGWILPGSVPYGCRPEEKPPTLQRCNYGDCGSAHHWAVGSWGKVMTFNIISLLNSLSLLKQAHSHIYLHVR